MNEVVNMWKKRTVTGKKLGTSFVLSGNKKHKYSYHNSIGLNKLTEYVKVYLDLCFNIDANANFTMLMIDSKSIKLKMLLKLCLILTLSQYLHNE